MSVHGNKTQKANARRNVWLRDSGRCWLCCMKVTLREMTLDHVVPGSKGGSNAQGNLRAAHALCNRQRGNDDAAPRFPTLDEWTRILLQRRDES